MKCQIPFKTLAVEAAAFEAGCRVLVGIEEVIATQVFIALGVVAINARRFYLYFDLAAGLAGWIIIKGAGNIVETTIQ